MNPKRCHRSLRAVIFSLLFFSFWANAQDPTFPELSGRVVDNANLISQSVANDLSNQLEAHENATSNQVVIVSVPDLDGYDIADYANRLGRHWQIGTANFNNGVVFLIAPNERKVRIEVGYGLEGALPDSLASIIIQREILPEFKKNQYESGIVSGTEAILLAIEGEYVAPSNSGSTGKDGSEHMAAYVPLIFIAMVAIPEFLRRRGAKRIANSAFMGGFAGLFGTIASGQLLIGLIAAVAFALLVYFKGSGGNGNGNRSGHIGTGGFGGGSFGGGGGFSGGGGSFGGGGASGSW